MVNVGIIGTGGIADQAHAPAVNEHDSSRLVSVLSRSEEKGRAFLNKHKVDDGKVFTNLSDFAHDEDLDLAIICTPDQLHYEQAKSCLENGKHVLIEKPMTLTVEQSEELMTLADSKNLVIAVGFHHRSHTGHIELKRRMLSENAIGDIRHIRVIWTKQREDDSDWRASEQLTKWWSLSALGSHCLDLARWFAEDNQDWADFRVVTSNQVWQGPHDETAIVAAELQSGPTVEIVSSMQFDGGNRIEIYGSKGFAVCDNTLGRDGAGTIMINNENFDFAPGNPFVAQLDNVIGCIEDRGSLNAGGEAGLRSIKDLLLALERD